MKQRPAGRPSSSEKIIRDIKRKTRKQYGAEEKTFAGALIEHGLDPVKILAAHSPRVGTMKELQAALEKEVETVSSK